MAIKRTIKLAPGSVFVRKLRPDILDTLHTHLRQRGKFCDGKVEVDRWSTHVTGDARRTSANRWPQGPSIVRIHAIISAALNLAVRYGWIDRNPAVMATVPRTRGGGSLACME